MKTKLKKDLCIEVKANEEMYEPCIYGRTPRLPFGTRMKSTKPDELVSTNVCGPFDESFEKKRYYVLFKDNYTTFDEKLRNCIEQVEIPFKMLTKKNQFKTYLKKMIQEEVIQATTRMEKTRILKMNRKILQKENQVSI